MALQESSFILSKGDMQKSSLLIEKIYAYLHYIVFISELVFLLYFMPCLWDRINFIRGLVSVFRINDIFGVDPDPRIHA
jgi:hypothetical protein